jgi:hypothetical protein
MLHVVGLLPIARLVEGDRLRAKVPQAERLMQFNYNTPADRRVHGPVATRDTHVPLPYWRDDSQSEGRRDVGRTTVCWPGNGVDRHPHDVAH